MKFGRGRIDEGSKQFTPSILKRMSKKQLLSYAEKKEIHIPSNVEKKKEIIKIIINSLKNDSLFTK